VKRIRPDALMHSGAQREAAACTRADVPVVCYRDGCVEYVTYILRGRTRAWAYDGQSCYSLAPGGEATLVERYQRAVTAAEERQPVVDATRAALGRPRR